MGNDSDHDSDHHNDHDKSTSTSTQYIQQLAKSRDEIVSNNE